MKGGEPMLSGETGAEANGRETFASTLVTRKGKGESKFVAYRFYMDACSIHVRKVRVSRVEDKR